MVRTNSSLIKTRTFQGFFKANSAIFKDNNSKYCIVKAKENRLAFILAHCTMKPLFFKSQETNTQKHEI